MILHINLAKGFRGGERQTLLLIKALSKKKIRQCIIIRRKNSLLKKNLEIIENIKIIEISKPFFFSLFKLKGLFTKNTIIHCHEAKSVQFGFLINMFYGSGYIITKRNDTKLNNNFSIFLYKKASKVIAISESIKKNLIIINKMIDVVPDGIEDIQFNNDVSIFLKNKYFNKKIIGNIAAMDNDSKGHDILINVANLLKTEKNVVFFLIGGGKKFSFFKKESEFLDNIEFTGFVENPYDYLSIMNIFLFPSLSEGLGSSILDALYLGVPVIASNVGGIPDIIQDNYNGFLVNPHNIDEIMEKINILIQNEEIRKKFIKNGFETVKNYDINLIADKYINIYKEINNEIFY